MPNPNPASANPPDARDSGHFRQRRCLIAGPLLLAAGCGGGGGSSPPPTDVPDPAQALIFTDDVDRYWRAYDAGGRAGDPVPFQTAYLTPASTGLREFVGLRALTALSLARAAAAAPAYLDALHAWWQSGRDRDTAFATIRSNHARLLQLYPAATFPPLTLLIGRFSTAGTAGTSGLLIGLEFFGVEAQAPLAGLDSFVVNNQMSLLRDLPPLVAHEQTHYLALRAGTRAGSSGATLLARVLNEGTAEFVAELVAGRPTYLRHFRAWQADEARWFAEFQRDMNGTDVSRWLYNQGSAGSDRPGDLGYFIGYRIAQAYYLQAADKARAVRDLIELADPAGLYARSGYTGMGPAIG